MAAMNYCSHDKYMYKPCFTNFNWYENIFLTDGTCFLNFNYNENAEEAVPNYNTCTSCMGVPSLGAMLTL